MPYDIDALYSDFLEQYDAETIARAMRVASYTHVCRGALHVCCRQQLCETCYRTHLRTAHSLHAYAFYDKLALSSAITWPARNAPARMPEERQKSRRTQIERAQARIDEAAHTPTDLAALLQRMLRELFMLAERSAYESR